MRHLLRSLVPALAFLLAPALLAAQDEPLSLEAGLAQRQARPWLEKMVAVYQRAPFAFNLRAEIDVGSGEQSFRGHLRGRMVYLDRQRSNASLVMNAPNRGKLHMTSVSDGTTTWTQILVDGETRVIKLDTALAERMAARGMALPGGGIDPVAQIQALTSRMDFELHEQDEHHVVLVGRFKAGEPQLDQLPFREMRLVLDTETAFPVEVSMGRDAIRIEISGFEFFDRNEIDPALFKYSPPKGAQVTDLGPALEAQLASAGKDGAKSGG